MALIYILASTLLVHSIKASTLATPPKSAVIFSFDDFYDLSLLANTLSHQGIKTTFVIPHDSNDYYEHMVEVDVVLINSTFKDNESKEERALKLCESILSDSDLRKKLDKPTYTIFPAIRHDACLLPWAESVSSIPVIWARGFNEEIYAFVKTGMALPIHETSFVQSFVENLNLKYLLYSIQRNYINSAFKIVQSNIPQASKNLERLYDNVQLILWGADPVLRINCAPLTQLVTEIGCHHCRGVNPLPLEELQKSVVEFKSGTIVILLDSDYNTLVKEIAQKLPSDREGFAVIWKSKPIEMEDKPNNFFLHKTVDRQDLIGYSRARLVIAHCTDSEFLENVYHGTPVICLPRTIDELRNTQRAVELGFALTQRLDTSKSDDLVEMIKTIHENTKYRENAKIASRALRDRSSHAMDRILYWLGYIVRHNGEGNNLLFPKKVSTYAEFLQTIIGFIVGVFFTAMGTLIFLLTQNVNENQKKKEKKMRHRN